MDYIYLPEILVNIFTSLSPKILFIKILSKFTRNYFYILDNIILKEIYNFKLFLRFLYYLIYIIFENGCLQFFFADLKYLPIKHTRPVVLARYQPLDITLVSIAAVHYYYIYIHIQCISFQPHSVHSFSFSTPLESLSLSSLLELSDSLMAISFLDESFVSFSKSKHYYTSFLRSKHHNCLNLVFKSWVR